VSEVFEQDLPELACRVQRAPGGEGLVWIDRDAAGCDKRQDVNPQAGWLERFGLQFHSRLPIDGLL
jgi:hypothetical protein